MSVYKRGNKYWIRFRINRTRYRKPSPDNSYAGAKAYEAVLRQKIAKGEPINEEKQKIPTFKEFSKKWFDIYVKNNNKESEILNKKSILRVHIIPFFGSKPIDKISGLDIENFKAKKIKEGLANKTINNLLIVLNKSFNTAQEWELIKTIPKVKLLKVQPQKFDFLTEEESQLLLDNSEELLKDMILVALKTGLRFGELISLEWEDIDFRNNLITVRKSAFQGKLYSTKSNKIRYIPMLDEISKVLFQRSKETGFVFSNNENKLLIPMTMLRQLHKACKRAKLREIGWHTLRHTFASHLAQNGISITLIKELLGHADIRTTMRYSHLNSSAIKEAIFSLNKNIGHNMATINNLENKKKLNLSNIKTEIMVTI